MEKFIQGIPKAELHLHIEGTFEPKLMFDIAKRNGIKIPFDSVEVLGLGEDGETLVVNNPAYQIPCWAPLDGFYLDKLDLKILPIIPGGISE